MVVEAEVLDLVALAAALGVAGLLVSDAEAAAVLRLRLMPWNFWLGWGLVWGRRGGRFV